MVAHRAARVVIAQRLEAIAESCHIHDRRHVWHRHRCLCATNRVVRPKHGKSTNTTLRTPCLWAIAPHAHVGRRSLVARSEPLT